MAQGFIRNKRATPAGHRLFDRLAPAVLVLSSLTACDNGQPTRSNPDYKEIEVWVHSGQETERRTFQDQVNRFNNSQYKVRINAVVLPEGSYNSQVQAAAASGELPDVLEFDGPFVYNYVWQGHLAPIDKRLTDNTRLELLPSIVEQGMYRGRLYSVGTYDSGLGIYVRPSMLKAAGVRIPRSIEDAWSVREFNRALAALAARDSDGAVLDLKLNYSGEWYTYAFSPVIQSAGGDLIDRDDYLSAQGVLNGEAAISAMETVQGWIEDDYVDPNLDDAAFIEGRVAMSWAGHWEYGRYSDAFGDDLALVPLPDFGNGPRTAQGSWSWGVTADTRDMQAAMHFIEFLFHPEEVLSMSSANSAVPATRTAIERSPLYREGGPLHLFVEQLETIAVPRPRTPAYPIITSAFQKAFLDIRNGSDVRSSLDAAVEVIDQDISDNRGYPPAR